MGITVYGMELSAPVRCVMMTCEVVGVDYEFKKVDLMAGENKTPEYLKINPQHNIPAIVDGDVMMNESRAIAGYLANSYAKSDCVYPKEPKTRGRVDQLMYFDMGQLYKSFGDVVYPILFTEDASIEKEKYAKLQEVLGWARDFIAETGYVAGTKGITLADLCFVATLSTVQATGIVDFEKEYPELKAYIEKLSAEIPNYEKANGAGAAAFGGWGGDKVKKALEKFAQ